MQEPNPVTPNPGEGNPTQNILRPCARTITRFIFNPTPRKENKNKVQPSRAPRTQSTQTEDALTPETQRTGATLVKNFTIGVWDNFQNLKHVHNWDKWNDTPFGIAVMLQHVEPRSLRHYIVT
jgi:hypothetical protein